MTAVDPILGRHGNKPKSPAVRRVPHYIHGNCMEHDHPVSSLHYSLIATVALGRLKHDSLIAAIALHRFKHYGLVATLALDRTAFYRVYQCIWDRGTDDDHDHWRSRV